MFDAANIADAQQFALERMMLKITGDTHSLLSGVAQDITDAVLGAADEDGLLPIEATIPLRYRVGSVWRAAISEWLTLFRGTQTTAAWLAFAQPALAHEHYLSLPITEKTQDEIAIGMNVFFDRQIASIVEAANQRVYEDGLNLSRRIWKLDNGSLQSLQSIIAAGAANGQSAYGLARDIEQFLGADASMTRWVSTRLRLTKADIAAGDLTGLISKRQQLALLSSDQPIITRGVAYNALRLARTEIKAIHAMASERMFAEQPWVQQQNWTLSPAHPRVDICDAGNAQNPYPIGAGGIPAHPNCLCYWTAITMSDDDFIRRMRGWINGSSPWADMDNYSNNLGFGVGDVVSGAARQLPELWVAALLEMANGTASEMQGFMVAAAEREAL